MINKLRKLSIWQIGTIITFVVVVLFLIFNTKYTNDHFNSLSTRIADLSTQLDNIGIKLSSTTADLSKNITQTHDSLNDALNQQKQNSAVIAQQLGNYQQQVSTVSSTVSTLQKLSNTDQQLLEKYSKVFFLNEYYAPAKLTPIPGTYEYSETKQLMLQNDVWTHLNKLIDDAKKENTTLYVYSAYRSFNEQSALKKEYKIIYGAGTANSFSAE